MLNRSGAKEHQTIKSIEVIYPMNEPSYYHQIDFIKTIAITAVILLHSLPAYILLDIYSPFHISQAIPVFIMVSGIVWYLSYNKITKHTFKDSYTLAYFKHKIKRLIVPFLIIYIIDIVYIITINFAITTQGLIRILTFQLPSGGPGSYYTSLIIQIILIAPIIFYCYQKNPNLTLASLVGINFCFELIAPMLPYWIYYISSLRYLTAFALGIYLSAALRTKTAFYKTKGFLVLSVLAIASFVYILVFMRQPTPFFRPEWETQNLLSFFYPAFIVAIILLIYPFYRRLSNVGRKLNVIGKASYHIFLVQLIYFGVGLNGIFLFTGISSTLMGMVYVTANLVSTFSLGLIFYYIDKRQYGYTKLKAIFQFK